MSPQTDLDHVRNRLVVIEAQVRWLKRLIIAGPALGLALAGLLAADSITDSAKFKTVTTERLSLVDERGRQTASLTTESSGPQLVLHDSKGQARVRIAAFHTSGPAILLRDADNKLRASLKTNQNHEAEFSLNGENEEPWIAMGLSDSRSPYILLNAPDGKSPVWRISSDTVQK